MQDFIKNYGFILSTLGYFVSLAFMYKSLRNCKRKNRSEYERGHHDGKISALKTKQDITKEINENKFFDINKQPINVLNFGANSYTEGTLEFIAQKIKKKEHIIIKESNLDQVEAFLEEKKISFKYELINDMIKITSL